MSRKISERRKKMEHDPQEQQIHHLSDNSAGIKVDSASGAADATTASTVASNADDASEDHEETKASQPAVADGGTARGSKTFENREGRKH